MPVNLSPGTFYGQTRRQIELFGLTFAESIYAPGCDLCIPLHEHANSYVYYIIEGICDETFERQTRTSGPSALMFHPAGEPHANHWRGSGGRVFHIDISAARFEAIREHAPVLDGPAQLLLGESTPWLARRLYREYRSPDVSALALEGLALEILAEASRNGVRGSQRTPRRWLVRARELFQDRFTENISFDEVAAAVGIHPVHLAREFRRHFGCAPGEYIRRLRVEFACRRLASTDTPLIEVALSAGFADQSHFTRTFRRQMRMTPGEFRRRFRSR